MVGQTILMLLLGLLIQVGFLSGGVHHETGTLSGKVQVGGQPLTGCDINFFSADTGIGMIASLNSDGTYQVKDKVWTGNYVVYFTPPLPESMGAADPDSAAKNGGSFQKIVDKRYRDETKTPLKAVVNKGANSIDFNL